MSDVFDFLDDDTLRVPLKSTKHPQGKEYAIPSPDAATGLWLQGLADISVKRHKGLTLTEKDAARLIIADGDEREFFERVLGTAYQEMLDDGVAYVRLQKVTQYAFVAFTAGKQAADEAAQKGAFAGGKVRANRAERRQKPKKGKKGN